MATYLLNTFKTEIDTCLPTKGIESYGNQKESVKIDCSEEKNSHLNYLVIRIGLRHGHEIKNLKLYIRNNFSQFSKKGFYRNLINVSKRINGKINCPRIH